jgi:hypothetical protein
LLHGLILRQSTTNTKALVAGYSTSGNQTGAYIQAVNFGTAYEDLVIQPQGGNLGLGVTPSAWNSVYRTMQLGSGSSLSGRTDDATWTELMSNAYRASDGNWKYLSTNVASAYLQASGSHAWYTAPSGTAGNAITFTQALTLNANGALVLQGGDTSASGVGVTFPATQSASSNANTLDDYEEGSWTPTFAGSTTNPTVTYVVRIGRYTKIGNQVTVWFELGTSANTGGAGNLFISGLPFNQNNDVRSYVGVPTYNIDNPLTNPLGMFVEGANNQSYFYLLATSDNAGWQNVTWANATSATIYVQGTITYQV